METVSPRLFAVLTVTASAVIGLNAHLHLYDQSSSPNPNENHHESSQAHVHASFYVSVNGTNLDLSNRSFQLQSREVHLENGNPRIVHRHEHGVTWNRFLETLDIAVKNQSGKLCVEVRTEKHCGNGTVVLDGERDPELDREIEQSQSLAIVIGQHSYERARELMRRPLPKDYKPGPERGNRV